MLACRQSAANNWRKEIFKRIWYFLYGLKWIEFFFLQEFSKILFFSGKCDNCCEIFATVHLSFCDHKVAPLKDWLKWLQNLQLTRQQVSLLMVLTLCKRKLLRSWGFPYFSWGCWWSCETCRKAAPIEDWVRRWGLQNDFAKSLSSVSRGCFGSAIKW